MVLSAFGCGTFGNPPEKVAPIYQQELQKRPGCFDDVVFAIYTSENNNKNFEAFYEVLDGISLVEVVACQCSMF